MIAGANTPENSASSRLSDSTAPYDRTVPENPFSALKVPTSPSTHAQTTAPLKLSENANDEGPQSSQISRAVALLTSKASLGHLASFAGSATMAYAGLSLLFQGASTPFIATLLALKGLELVSSFKRNQRKIEALINEPIPSRSHTNLERVRNLVTPLCADLKIAEPHIHFCLKSSPNAGMIDRLRGKDVLLISEDLLYDLTDRELRAVLAHELAHQDRFHNVVADVARNTSALAVPCLSWGAIFTTFGAVAGTTGVLIATPIALGAGLLSTCVAAVPLGLCRLYISRQNELATDLRACRATGDPEALISALGRIASYRSNSKGIEHICAKLGLLSHPTLDERARNIRRTFGSNA
jgi:Zn-dependent protease with chaperone function